MKLVVVFLTLLSVVSLSQSKGVYYKQGVTILPEASAVTDYVGGGIEFDFKEKSYSFDISYASGTNLDGVLLNGGSDKIDINEDGVIRGLHGYTSLSISLLRNFDFKLFNTDMQYSLGAGWVFGNRIGWTTIYNIESVSEDEFQGPMINSAHSYFTIQSRLDIEIIELDFFKIDFFVSIPPSYNPQDGLSYFAGLKIKSVH
ncbi:MAG: hypothetical protein HRU38_22740 [Saccharospirillaceae bacterium]|nr:hypothetical protein [Pseudomonadales bacterium]NRB81443.1 hypothetical protein [Saccharospirillaceae bacterium]